MSSSKSHQINLYDPTDLNQFYIENEAAGLCFKDTKTDRDAKWYVQDLRLYEPGAAPGPGFGVKARFASVEGDVTVNATLAAAAQQAADAEAVRAQAAEAGLGGTIAAEVARAGVAEAAIQAEVDAEEAKRYSEDFLLDGKINQEALDRAAAVAVEKARAEAAEAALQQQVSNILANTDSTALNSLAEIVTAFTNGDNSLSGALATLQTSFDDLKQRFDDLVANS